MSWTILSLNLLTGVFSLSGDFTNQMYCIKAAHETTAPEFAPHVRQCVQVKKEDVKLYALDSKDWSKL
jgi:hypothetical protein